MNEDNEINKDNEINEEDNKINEDNEIHEGNELNNNNEIDENSEINKNGEVNMNNEINEDNEIKENEINDEIKEDEINEKNEVNEGKIDNSIKEEETKENKPNNISQVEAKKIFNQSNGNNESNKPKGWKLDEKWEWCRNISIVYTWVNGSDPNHQEIKSNYNGGIKKVDQRDRSMDELRYSLRSLEKNLPWHEGLIYIVSPNQIPSWLNTEHPRIKIIDQATLLPPEYNPTFNSFSIEFYLDKIPGLTERFIQLNDDYFFKRYIHPSFFFNQKKFPNFYYGRTHVHKGFKEAYQISNLKEKTTWHKKYWGSIFHTNGVIKEKYGEEAHIVMLQHAPYVWYRDIFEPMRQYYGKYISQTLSHKFRHPLDLIPTYAHQQYIINVASNPGYKLSDQPHQYPSLDFGFYPHKNAEKWITEYGYRPLSRNAVKNYIRFGTVLDDKQKSMKLFNIIKNGPYLMFNLNDDYTTEEPAEWLLEFMNELFPNASLFEKN
ncbi:hypothetical protein U3516DRAFT_885698 [Neocallimastix sp. 'constans']|jgi:hypothetical protein